MLEIMKKGLYIYLIIFILQNIGLSYSEDKITEEKNFVERKTFIKEKPHSLADIIEPLTPSVVSIHVIHKSKINNLDNNQYFPFRDFDNFLKEFGIPFEFFEEMPKKQQETFLGSGFIIDSTGYIVTNNHVVLGADEIKVKLVNDNVELTAKLVGSDKKTDLALLKVESPKPLPYVNFGDSAKSRVGDQVIVIGNPFGLGGTVTLGIISSKGRDIDSNKGVVDDFIQTDAAINRGNSGGPMFNLDGQVIGVNTAIYSQNGGNIGIGFAIPSNTVQNVVEQLKKYQKVSRGMLGITLQAITPDIAEGLGLKEAEGALVSDVLEGGAGAKCGIKSGDLIIKFNDTEIKNSRKLQVLVSSAQIDSEAQLVVVRNKERINLKCKIADSDKNGQLLLLQKGKDSGYNVVINGVKFSDITASIASKYNITRTKGIIITDIARNSSWRPYLLLGDIILSVNNDSDISAKKLEKIIRGVKSKSIVLLVKRQDTKQYVVLPNVNKR